MLYICYIYIYTYAIYTRIYIIKNKISNRLLLSPSTKPKMFPRYLLRFCKTTVRLNHFTFICNNTISII